VPILCVLVGYRDKQKREESGQGLSEECDWLVSVDEIRPADLQLLGGFCPYEGPGTGPGSVTPHGEGLVPEGTGIGRHRASESTAAAVSQELEDRGQGHQHLLGQQ
jgi:hypothetical protein